ncbi:ATP-binding cassette domain-containing protein [Chloroflexi bacterium TSY]|nr:ATP-binding cassette domain-containing protein [Chloroflexi bacterium TSY]
MSSTTSRQRRFFLPLVDTDVTYTYGPALLKTILLGYHVSITDDELIQAIDEVGNPDLSTGLQEIAQRFGLQLEQTLLPADHLYLPDALPALVMMRPISEEPPHWAVVWQRLGRVYQVIDPKLGRLWLNATQLLTEVSSEALSLSPDEWHTVATATSSRQFFQQRLSALELEPHGIDVLLEAAYRPSNELGPAILDAALRTVEHVVQRGGFRRGPEAAKAVAQHYARGLTFLIEQRQLLVPVNWAVLPDLSATDMANAPVQLFGVAALRITGVAPKNDVATETESSQPEEDSSAIEASESSYSSEAESLEAEASPETATSPETAETKKRSALDYLRQEGYPVALLIGMAMLLAGAGMFFQAILFRGLAELSLNLVSLERRIWAISLLLIFTLTMIGLKWFSHNVVQTLGHRLDGRLRLAVLAQLPRLSNLYFQQISAGDMIERIHNVRAVRKLPFYMSEFLHIFFQFLMTVVGLLLLDWVGALITFVKLFVPFFFIYFGGYLGSETERTRTYLGFLSRFYLDAMEGLVAIRTHGAEQATRREYEDLLGKWVQSNINVYQGEWRYNVISTALSYSMTAVVIFLYVVRDKNPANLLLVAYWSVNLESLRGPLIFLAISYLFDQGKAARFLQLLDAPIEEDVASSNVNQSDATDELESLVDESKRIELENETDTEKEESTARGLAITLRGVNVIAAEQHIFKEVDLTIPAGSQIGIVGPSGAGKSTLVGLLLGWHYPASGQILIDDEPFDYARLRRLRAETAWVDPTIQLWNRSFLHNLRYGGSRMPLNLIIDQADLRTVLERLPDGMQTRLGGEGRLVSGGEGQRMRFGRGLQRPDARLVILDEPFRGLDRDKRRTLLSRARAYWPHATMLCITHDVGQTQGFERVLVVEDGRIIEDDTPQALLERPDSRYRSLLAAEDAVREQLWSSESWRRLWLENGQLYEGEREGMAE